MTARDLRCIQQVGHAAVFTARDIAAAAGVAEAWVEHLLARGEIRSVAALLPAGVPLDPALTRFVSHDEAVRAVRALSAGLPVALPCAGGVLGRELFGETPRHGRPTTVPLVVSSTLHGLVAASILVVASLSFASANEPTEPLKDPDPPMRLVFLATPDPGGGGGGGGLRMKTPSQGRAQGQHDREQPHSGAPAPTPARGEATGGRAPTDAA
jgi:hypothetical protein